jgi:hypothetical protein
MKRSLVPYIVKTTSMIDKSSTWFDKSSTWFVKTKTVFNRILKNRLYFKESNTDGEDTVQRGYLRMVFFPLMI